MRHSTLFHTLQWSQISGQSDLTRTNYICGNPTVVFISMRMTEYMALAIALRIIRVIKILFSGLILYNNKCKFSCNALHSHWLLLDIGLNIYGSQSIFKLHWTWFQPYIYRRRCPTLPFATLLIPTVPLQTSLSLIATCNCPDSNCLSKLGLLLTNCISFYPVSSM